MTQLMTKLIGTFATTHLEQGVHDEGQRADVVVALRKALQPQLLPLQLDLCTESACVHIDLVYGDQCRRIRQCHDESICR